MESFKGVHLEHHSGLDFGISESTLRTRTPDPVELSARWEARRASRRGLHEAPVSRFEPSTATQRRGSSSGFCATARQHHANPLTT